MRWHERLKIFYPEERATFYWMRKPGRKLWDVLKNDFPKRIEYKPEPQGESIAWHPSSIGFYTTSEERDGIKPQLIFYRF